MSIVIPMLNSGRTIGAQLEALADQTYAKPVEIVVADNGSSDDGPYVVNAWREKLPGLRIVDASHRRGVAAARNTGSRAARGRFLLCCDADDVVEPDWVEALMAEASDRTILGGPLDTSELNPPSVVDWRGMPRSDEVPTTFGRSYFLTANMGFSVSTFHALGGFRETFDCGGADVDFCLRAHDLGIVLRFVPTAIVQYRYRRSLRSFVTQSFEYGRSSSRLRRAHPASGGSHGAAPTAAAGAVRGLVGNAARAVGSETARARLAGQAGYLAGRAVGRVERWSPDGSAS